jgi:hypothetical protein
MIESTSQFSERFATFHPMIFPVQSQVVGQTFQAVESSML